MRAAIIACLVTLSACSALCQDLKQTYGKTNAQILSMGYDKWYDFFTGKEGEHTQGMAQSGHFYADALAWRNQRLRAKQPAAAQKRVKQLEATLKSFGSAVIEVNRALSGGGTLWQLTHSTNVVDVQETIYALVGGKSKPSRAMVVSVVKKELDALRKAVNESPQSTWQYGFKKADAQKDLKTAVATYDEIVALAKGLDRKKSDHVLAYCHRILSNARMGN